MEQTPILEGWLVKSPPEKKASGPFKLFKAKWRKRWFVLYEPLASQSLPGTRAALDYYNKDGRQASSSSSSSSRKRLGTIDLEHCEEVLCKLDTAYYQHVFSLRTKHKGRDRTYYLATESEADMMKWVDCLCQALGLKENQDQVVPPVAEPPQTVVVAPLVHQTVVPQPQAPPQHSPVTASRAAPPHNTYLSDQPPNNAAPQHYNVPRETREAYIPLEDCYTGPRASRALRGSRESVDSIPPEAPPEPPTKRGPRLADPVVAPLDPSTYDSPNKSYVNLDNNDNKVTTADWRHTLDDDDGIYKVPRGYHAQSTARPGSSDEEGTYKVPREFSQLRHQSAVEDDIYNVPPSQPREVSDIYNVPPSHPRGVSDIYNVPPSQPHQLYQIPPIQHTVTVDDRQSEGYYDVPPSSVLPPPRPGRDGSLRGSNSSGDSQRYDPGSRASTDALDVYDIPKNFAHDRASKTISRMSGLEIYDNPRPTKKATSENCLLESVVPTPRKKGSITASQLVRGETRYQNLPPTDTDDGVYDVPPTSPSASQTYYNDSDKLVMLPPPPPPCQTRHSYINTPHQQKTANALKSPVLAPTQVFPATAPDPGRPESFYMPMSVSVELGKNSQSEAAQYPMGEYTDMASVTGKQDLYAAPPSNRPVNPSVHDVVPPPSKTKAFIEPHGGVFDQQDTYTVFPTSRTRSFKRVMPGPGGEVVLPKRVVHQSEASSSDDESSSAGSHDKSSDSLTYRPMHMPLKPPPSLRPKVGSLNSTPPPPKNPGEVQYLDLELDKHSDAEPRAPHPSRAPPTGGASPTDYKEIDFVKTKALSQMQRDVENKRKSSERSMDE